MRIKVKGLHINRNDGYPWDGSLGTVLWENCHAVFARMDIPVPWDLDKVYWLTDVYLLKEHVETSS